MSAGPICDGWKPSRPLEDISGLKCFSPTFRSLVRGTSRKALRGLDKQPKSVNMGRAVLVSVFVHTVIQPKSVYIGLLAVG